MVIRVEECASVFICSLEQQAMSNSETEELKQVMNQFKSALKIAQESLKQVSAQRDSAKAEMEDMATQLTESEDKVTVLEGNLATEKENTAHFKETIDQLKQVSTLVILEEPYLDNHLYQST